MAGAYHGYCKQILWPSFHNVDILDLACACWNPAPEDADDGTPTARTQSASVKVMLVVSGVLTLVLLCILGRLLLSGAAARPTEHDVGAWHRGGGGSRTRTARRSAAGCCAATALAPANASNIRALQAERPLVGPLQQLADVLPLLAKRLASTALAERLQASA